MYFSFKAKKANVRVRNASKRGDYFVSVYVLISTVVLHVFVYCLVAQW